MDGINSKKSVSDDEKNYWKPTVDKAGNGSAIIRFLPDQDVEQIPFVRIFSHGFQGELTNRWYIENSLSTLGQEDPVAELNRKLWNSGIESDKEQARKQKRRISYFSNVLVLKDPANPSNEGKVFIYKYGQKIFDKIVAAAKPEFEDESAVNVFDPINGANFKVRIKKVAGYQNYDDSAFDTPKPLAGGDEDKIQEVLNQCHNIQALLDPKNFKTYDELARKLATVLGEDSASTPARSTRQAESEIDEEFGAAQTEVKKPVKAAPPPWADSIDTPKKAVKAPAAKSQEDDDDMEFFKSLASGD